MDNNELPTHSPEGHRYVFSNYPETWTEKQLMVEILKELKEIRKGQISLQSFILRKADPTKKQ